MKREQLLNQFGSCTQLYASKMRNKANTQNSLIVPRDHIDVIFYIRFKRES